MEVRTLSLVAALGAAMLVPLAARAADPEPATAPTPDPITAPAPVPDPVPTTPGTEPAPTEPTPAEPTPTEPKAEPKAEGPRGISIGADIKLHARFDLSYERYGYTDNPSDGKDAFRNYHHYVFLSRHSKDDGFSFNAEIAGLTFYEIGYRLRGKLDDPWRLSFTAGKMLVPFGSDPLYHHAYGGRIGQDQRFLPAVWADYGAKATLDWNLDKVRLRFDAYMVRGPAVRKVDTVLDMASASSPLDDINLAGGGRISASFGPAAINYSIYGSNLNFHRRTVMQALDVSLYRLAGVPFLEDLVVSAGVVRADVWGGGQPASYNFADYVEVRYYPVDWLFLQYRGGLDTRDNRSGVFADPARLDKLDTSAHSVGLGFTYQGFTLLAQHLWSIELADEQPDDFLRITATYEL